MFFERKPVLGGALVCGRPRAANKGGSSFSCSDSEQPGRQKGGRREAEEAKGAKRGADRGQKGAKRGGKQPENSRFLRFRPRAAAKQAFARHKARAF